MTYEGTNITDSWGRAVGLKVKNGEIVTEPKIAWDEIKNRIIEINSGPLPQTVAKRKALAEAQANKRR